MTAIIYVTDANIIKRAGQFMVATMSVKRYGLQMGVLYELHIPVTSRVEGVG